MKHQPKLSILIPAFNEASYILQTLTSIKQSFQEIFFSSYEIIVCDNNSTDATAKIARQEGAVVVFEAHNQISKARNAAALHAKGEWILFIDADTLLNAKVLKATLTMIKQKSICAGGALLKVDNLQMPLLARVWIGFWNLVSMVFKYPPGSYLFCRQAVWHEIGGFDEKLYAGEDVDFCKRLKKWARLHSKKIGIVRSGGVVTSARKVEWYSLWTIVKGIVGFILSPQAKYSREKCGIWYQRPDLRKSLSK